jgi:hypothetical protein
MLAIALVLAGKDRKTAAETCVMDRQTLRDFVHGYHAKQGSRPRAPRDLRHEWAYIFGVVCPAPGATAASPQSLTTIASLVLPHANTEAFPFHLDLAEIGKEVATGAHAILTRVTLSGPDILPTAVAACLAAHYGPTAVSGNLG